MQSFNQLLLGDNLEILRAMPDESVDLIYLDPPFFSNRTYEVIWGDKGEVRSFEDRFSGGIDHYIAWLKERVAEMHRILKPTGSLFLHCDWHANAEIKVFILNKIFGANNFRGDIVWQRHNAHNDAKKKLAVLTDTIWYYSKSDKFTYNPIYTNHTEAYKDMFYKFNDNDGRGDYAIDNMTSPNIRRNMIYEWLGFSSPEKGWRYEKETMQRLHDEKRIYYPTNKDGSFDLTKRPRLKRYLDEQKGTLLGNFWTDINNISSQAKERIGYPTQKPLALLHRIIEMASNEGDVVLDPFVGGGTTVLAADRLQRGWIGIDQSVAAIKVTEMRMEQAPEIFSKPFTVKLHKYDYDTLRYKDAFAFESFIVTAYGAQPNTKQRGDLGIDGKTRNGVAIQVKRSDNVGRNVVDNFHSAVQRFDQALYDKNKNDGGVVGIIIAFSFNKGAIQEVARLRNEIGVTIELVTVETIIPIAKKPTIDVSLIDKGKTAKGLHEIEFTAMGVSEAGIEFYAWDWDYKVERGFRAAILIDKTGVQVQQFKAGTHTIGVKVVDNEGLEGIEVVRLKVNGVMTQL